MKYIILLISILTLTSCMSDQNARISVNVFAPPGKQIEFTRADANPSANSSTNANSGSGVTIIIKHMTKETNLPTGITATVPASSLGF